MTQQQKIAIVMNSDQQILRGLILLLEDMKFYVISVSHHDEIENINISHTDCPALLLMPLVFDNGESGNDLIKTLRTSFQQQIPAILLSHEDGIAQTRLIAEDIIVLSDQTKPNDLRRKITDILSNTLAV